ncbi:MAG: voltage-gated potassium channel, partial [Sulfurimonas sp.]
KSYKTVGQLDNKKYRIVLLGVYKNNEQKFHFNPIDTTNLEMGDYILVIGNEQFLKEFTLHLNKKSSNVRK